MKFSLTILFLLSLGLYSEDKNSVAIIVSNNNSSTITTLNSIHNSILGQEETFFISGKTDEQVIELLQAIESKDSSLVITLGSRAALLAKSNLKRTAMLYSLVNSPRTNQFQVGTNSCGIHTDVPITEFYTTLREIKKKNWRIGSFYSNQTSESILKESDYQDANFGFTLYKKKLDSQEDLRNELEKLKGKIDAFYLVPDPIYQAENFFILSEFCKKNQIVLMTEISSLVPIGATFSISPFYSRIGIQVADFANKILLDKEKCIDGIARNNKDYSFQLNIEYAEESEIEINEGLKKKSQANRLLLEAINLFEKGNYELSKVVIDKVIQGNKSDSTANFYLSELNTKLNGGKIQSLFNKGELALEKKQYKQAREAFTEVLKIDRNSAIAEQKYREVIELESDEERVSAERLEKVGDILGAINRYNTALTILPSNQKAKSNLETLRLREKVNIPKYFTQATKSYNIRKYDDAEIGFKKILAINPNDKTAQEYLKLTQDKKISMKKFEDCIDSNDTRCKLIWQKKK
ncbi:MAG: ABC transporter substrate binding protein [Leptospiraceae bacterium]|nr:ABC transporter substrate binding protein [Leptospiraceae bacterium]